MSRESVTDVMRKAADFLPSQLAYEMAEAIAAVTKLIDVSQRTFDSWEGDEPWTELDAALTGCKGDQP